MSTIHPAFMILWVLSGFSMLWIIRYQRDIVLLDVILVLIGSVIAGPCLPLMCLLDRYRDRVVLKRRQP